MPRASRRAGHGSYAATDCRWRRCGGGEMLRWVMRWMVRLLLVTGGLRQAEAAALVQVVVAENHGVMFCHGCEDPFQEGSYVPALSSFYSPRGFFVSADLVYGVPNRGEQPLLNVEEVRGRVALFDRGRVSFARKVQYAQQAGAVAVVIVDNGSCNDIRSQCYEERLTHEADGSPSSSTVFQTDPYVAWRGVRIPSVLISGADGDRLKSFMSLEIFDIEGETHYINDL